MGIDMPVGFVETNGAFHHDVSFTKPPSSPSEAPLTAVELLHKTLSNPEFRHSIQAAVDHGLLQTARISSLDDTVANLTAKVAHLEKENTILQVAHAQPSKVLSLEENKQITESLHSLVATLTVMHGRTEALHSRVIAHTDEPFYGTKPKKVSSGNATLSARQIADTLHAITNMAAHIDDKIADVHDYEHHGAVG